MAESFGGLTAHSWRDRWQRLVERLRESHQHAVQGPTYLLSRWLFLRLLGLVYLAAFWSLYVQISGLAGTRGILPVGARLNLVEVVYQRQHGALLGMLRAWLEFPTLQWFVPAALRGAADSGVTDLVLHATCWLGMLGSVLVVAGVVPIAALAVCWGCYLSLYTAGGLFLSYQWDALLLETGLLAMLYAPAQLLPALSRERWPSAAGRWLLWLLLFKLMFLSGITKLLSTDPTWANWTALDYHYQTQPLPTWVAWYAHHLPAPVQWASLAFMWLVELVVPFAIFAPARFFWLRRVAAGLVAALMVLILLTGNYGFFNILAIVLCVPLLDDELLGRLAPGRLRMYVDELGFHESESYPRFVFGLAAAAILVPLSVGSMARESIATSIRGGGLPQSAAVLLKWTDGPYGWFQRYHLTHGYGLFRVMTTSRSELVFEGSHDGRQWFEYPFRYKPAHPARRPGFCIPHMPRLDWQLWFAALDVQHGNPQSDPLLRELVRALLEGRKEVLDLVGGNPFATGPPKFVRVVHYRYTFSEQGSSAWWRRVQIAASPAATLTDTARGR